MNDGEHGAVPAAIPTGSAALNRALGIGGIPRGRIVEITGPPVSGKTTLALHILAEALCLGGAVAYIDGGHTLDPAYVYQCGVDPDRVSIDRPASAKEALERVVYYARDAGIAALILDAIGLLPPDENTAGADAGSAVGQRARLMSQALRLLSGALPRTNAAIIVLTATPAEGDDSPLGRALKFYASVRLALQPVGPVRRGAEIVGQHVTATVLKNKVAPPFGTAEFDLIGGQRDSL